MSRLEPNGTDTDSRNSDDNTTLLTDDNDGGVEEYEGGRGSGGYEEGVEMTVDTEESEELATAEEEADTVVRETCIFLSSLKS